MKIVLILLLITFTQFTKAQEIRAELVSFIGQQLEENNSLSNQDAAKLLSSRISKEYGLKSLDPEYTKFISSVLNQQKKHKSPARMNFVQRSLYRQVIASAFLQSENAIVAKKLGCDEARSNLNKLLQQLPDAISDLMNCIQDLDWEDAIQAYNDVDFWSSLLIGNYLSYSFSDDGSTKPLFQMDPRHPDYYFLGCKKEIEKLRKLNIQIAEAAEA